MLLPAIHPDVVLIHAPMADRAGNVWIGRQRELATMAHAGKRTVATVEKIVDGDLLDDPILAAGTLPGFYVETDRGRAERLLAARPAGSLSGRPRASCRIRPARRDRGRLCTVSR